jgi:hypothetical protein
MAHKRNNSLSCLNQLMILRNYTTLWIKGIGRMHISQDITQQWQDGTGTHFACHICFLAHHYQLFKHLPAGTQGGDVGQSLLNDEQVQMVARTYLLDLPVGKVTSAQFHHALNEWILPLLGHVPMESGVSLCMAWQWLCKLGWWCTEMKKGVYMDGHERPDVVEYCNKVFLPLMALLERRMVQ